MNINTKVQMIIQFNGRKVYIPILPEKLTISSNASNEDIEILGIGKATEKGEPSLIKTTIESFFPAETSAFFYLTEGTTATDFIDFINEIWHTENINNNVAKIISTGLDKNFESMPFVIEDFSYDYVAGDFDISYKLSIKEYRSYGVKLANEFGHSRIQSPFLDTSTVQNTYTVQSGDCLWNITKACCGDGSKWNELYALNKDVIGNNPNFIKPGQVLTLPSNWKTPTKVEKLKVVNKSNVAKPTQVQNNAVYELSKASVQGNILTMTQAIQLEKKDVEIYQAPTGDVLYPSLVVKAEASDDPLKKLKQHLAEVDTHRKNLWGW